MAYNRHIWEDEVVQHPRRITLKDTTSGSPVATYDYERVLGTVVAQDPVNAQKLNNIEVAVAENSDYLIPTSIVGTVISIETESSKSRIFVEIGSLVSGGNVQINLNGIGPRNLYSDYGLTENVTELEAGVYEFINKDLSSAFYLAPKGADEWGGLQFVIDDALNSLYTSNSTTDLIYKLDLDTKLQIEIFTPPGTNSQGIGGIGGRLYNVDSVSDLVYELDFLTLLSLSSAPAASTNPQGIGGTLDRIYYCDVGSVLIYELDTDTKLQISNVASPSTLPLGIGGINARLYHVDTNTSLIYELDLDTKLPISNAPSATSPSGIGGVDTRLYYNTSPTFYEIDLDTKLQISSASAPSSGMRGIGGVKQSNSVISISKVLFNGTEYELTDDSQFRVSGVSV